MLLNTLCSLLLLNLSQADGQAYPRPDLLIEVSALAQPQVAKKFRVLDTRPAKEFNEERIPLSSSVDVPTWSKKFAGGPDVNDWEKRLGSLGIDVDVPVVVAGDDMRETARIWWILRYWGVKDVRILNGGWLAWMAGKHPVEKGQPSTKSVVAPTSRKLMPAEKRLATMDQVKDSLQGKLLQLIDARSEGEYCGDMKTAKRAGAIPGAVNLEWKTVLEPTMQKLKSAAELAQLFQKAGIDLAKPLAAYCQTGGRASVIVFAMELMGANGPRNYYRSWAEWGNADDTPVEKVKSKK
jgi:thiosulfate/3-mercaptopyruvate sulfurtransferase